MGNKKITDPNSIFKMAETLFKQFPVYMIIDNKPIQIKILAMKNLGVLIQSQTQIQTRQSAF